MAVAGLSSTAQRSVLETRIKVVNKEGANEETMNSGLWHSARGNFRVPPGVPRYPYVTTLGADKLQAAGHSILLPTINIKFCPSALPGRGAEASP